jgi:hypothetical protein
MAMMEILDSVRSIIQKWVNTSSQLSVAITSSDIAYGVNTVTVKNARRFQVGDQVFITDSSSYETDKIIEKIDYDNNIIEFVHPVLNEWPATSTLVIKAINENIVQGIYIGDPDVISHYPAITVNGNSRSSEWMTLRSTKERYEIEIGVYVKASSLENGYRFLMQITDIIQHGLKGNIIPLINDIDLIQLVNDTVAGSVNVEVSDITPFQNYRRVIIENDDSWQENWVAEVYGNPNGSGIINLREPLGFDFPSSGTNVIVPHRFIFNSWPATIEYGKIHKGELIKAAVIRWFAEEEELQMYQKIEPNLR